ncbi:MAG: hypothetical protein COA74_07440 [Gammaproteobacteria bacterium]|nr:MAG: hypothetical protein COA74_07440 [Gammaproteobacteria bacterium]
MKKSINRRSFLKQSLLTGATGVAGIAGSNLFSSIAGLGKIQAALAQNSFSSFPDYKALVCIFLHGGNDGFNLLVPRDNDNYGVYQVSRQNLAIAQEDLLAIAPSSGGDFGLHPAMVEMQSLFQSGQLAIQSNVGTLIEPVTKAAIQSGTAVLPERLFSHNDQSALWKTAYAGGPGNTGWGGRVADLISTQNTSQVSMNISIAGNNLFQVGSNIAPYSMNASGPEEMFGLNSALEWEQNRAAVFQRIRDLSSNHLLERTHANLIRNTQDTADLLITALASAPTINTVFPPGNTLAAQLEMVAKMIGSSDILGFQRQIFFVTLGGFDTHNRQNIDQPTLLSTLSQAMNSFYNATEELGVANQVTSFTLSDFGRTLTSNGDGTDHGWGSNHMIMGGAVNGGDIFGTVPELSIGGPDDVGDGRMIPTTSVEQYAATMARWFGINESELLEVFPNLANFNTSNLGFMTS